MAWDHSRAVKRIEALKASVPQGDIVVEDFIRYHRERQQELAKSAVLALDSAVRLRIPRNRVITTHGVHVYANLMDFNDRLVDKDRETEVSHRRALQLLHAHYRACDALAAEMDIQRVDFHGPRLHAVVLTPTGAENETARIEKALAFSAAFREMVARTANQFGGEYLTRVRVGVDSGPAVAMDGGRKAESEPVFIGSPANHAAKLADGDADGIFLSPRVRRLLNRPQAFDSTGMLAKALEPGLVREMLAFDGASAAPWLERAYAAVARDMEALKSATGAGPASFQFHYRAPPLSTLDYADHPPSNAVRMALVSLFADLDGFTAYIDQAIAAGQVAEAVANLHILRGEMAAVVREDFGGRKVRFVGDSIHALLAVGDAAQTDEGASVREAVMAAAGIRSSFELCRTMLPGVSQLGVAIGLACLR